MARGAVGTKRKTRDFSARAMRGLANNVDPAHSFTISRRRIIPFVPKICTIMTFLSPPRVLIKCRRRAGSVPASRISYRHSARATRYPRNPASLGEARGNRVEDAAPLNHSEDGRAPEVSSYCPRLPTTPRSFRPQCGTPRQNRMSLCDLTVEMDPLALFGSPHTPSTRRRDPPQQAEV